MSMAISICPECYFVESVQCFLRLSAVVNYYLCKRCGHIWSVRKNDPRIIDHFRPMPKSSQ